MANPKPQTIREQIAWSYSNLARAHAALKDDCKKYNKIHHMIRAKMYKGLLSGEMSMRSLYDDERVKLVFPQICCYCGDKGDLSVDHLIPRTLGGIDEADNLIWACRSCNSSKQGKDMLVWAKSKKFFPSILLLRRYIKIVAKYCDINGYMDFKLQQGAALKMPFDVRLLPTKFPPLEKLTLWVESKNDRNCF